jgi:diadenosine tetraphosphate (Ap4A) HIT family hydrolase
VARPPPTSRSYIGRGRRESKSGAIAGGKRGTVRKEAKMSEIGWSLHPQLHADTALVCDLALSRVLAMNDSSFPWLILVPRRAGVSEIFDLGTEQTTLLSEVSQVSRALKDVTQCDKLNVAAIGNVVPQLHIHVVARRKDDALWPKPVWGAAPPRAYEPAVLEHFTAAIRDRLRSTLSL